MAVNLMMEGGSPMALLWGKEYRLIYNDGYREIIQDKHPAALGATGAEVFPEIWAEIQPLFDQAFHGKAVVLDDFCVSLTRGGSTANAFFSGTYNPIRNEEGEVAGFIAVIIETTTRVIRERERAQVLITMLSTIADFVYTFDEEGRFLYANKALTDLFNLPLEQLVGKNFHELNYPAELAARLQQQIRDVFTGKVVKDETPFVGFAGYSGYYEYILSPVFSADKTVIAVAGCTRDITVRKNLERELREAHKRMEETILELETAKHLLEGHAGELERQVRERTAKLKDTIEELETFSYSISHDLRGPLRVMQSFAQALREDCGEAISPIGKDYIRRIIAATERMDRVIRDVLVYSRLDRTELPLQPVSLNDFFPSLLDGYPQFHTAKEHVSIRGDLPLVLANDAALTQCFANLIGNALKFVAPGVRPDVRISGRIAAGRAFVSVSDNGIGIPEHAQGQIFEPFKKLESGYEGTGIGLAIVRKAAERMGGRVGVISKPGQGSTFTIELALAETI